MQLSNTQSASQIGRQLSGPLPTCSDDPKAAPPLPLVPARAYPQPPCSPAECKAIALFPTFVTHPVPASSDTSCASRVPALAAAQSGFLFG